MSAKVRSVNFSPDEFIAGTVGMTPQELGVYWLICSLIYSTGGPIPQGDERLRALRCNPRATRSVVSALVDKGKIEIGPDGQMMVKRCRRELENAAKRMREYAENGSKGGRPRKQSEENQQDKKPSAFSAESPSRPQSPSPPLSPIKGPPRDPTFRSLNGKDGAPQKRTSVATRIDAAWQPTEEMRTYARSKGVDADHEAVKFVRFYTSPDCPKPARKDWLSTWQSWIDKAAEWLPARSSGSNGDRANSEASPVVTYLPPDDAVWTRRMDGWRKNRTWLGSWGPPPGEKYCKVPSKLL